MTLAGSGVPGGISIEVVYIDEDFEAFMGKSMTIPMPNGTWTIPLYKGKAVAIIDLENNYTVSGNATVDEEGIVTITGDFTVSTT